MMIGFVYFKKSNFKEEFLAYIPKKGWIKTSDEGFFEKYSSIIFISNLEESYLPNTFKNIKKDTFFSYDFEQIIYYFNASKLTLKEKLKVVSVVFNDALDFYKRNFNKEVTFNELLVSNSFSDLYDNVISEEFKETKIFSKDIIKDHAEMIYSSEQELVNFYLRRNEFDILEDILDLEIPSSDFDYVDINDLGPIKNIEQAIDTFSNEYLLITKGTLENFGVYNKKLLPKRVYGENSLFFKDEVIFLNDFSNIKIEGFYLSPNFLKFKKFIKYFPRLKKTRIANRIILSSYIDKIFAEIKEYKDFDFYLKQKLLSKNFKNVCFFKKNGFNVIAYTNNEIIVSVKKDDVEKLLKEVEKIDLLYSSDLISYFQ